MSPKTFSSCAAYPFTVSTRLGMRSARRCNTTSTCDHAEFMASRLRTISLRWPMNVLPNQNTSRTTMIRMITPVFMFLSLSLEICVLLPDLEFSYKFVDRLQSCPNHRPSIGLYATEKST